MDTIPDKQIEEEIKAFTGFRIHFTVYILVNVFAWVSWFAGGGTIDMEAWPVYLSLGWGLILVIHFLIAYRAFRERRNRSGEDAAK
jgi:hypothetical protein